LAKNKKVLTLIQTKIYKPLCIIFSMKKRGQVTIFLVVGIILISLVSLFFLSKKGYIPEIGGGGEVNINSYLSSCMEDKIYEAVDALLTQGGYIENPLHKEFKFANEMAPANISYLCYNQNYYFPCINQEPLLIQHLKEEIKDYISQDVENCFDEMVMSLEKQNYEVDSSYDGFEVSLAPRKVSLDIYGQMTLSRAEEISKSENVKISFPTKLYDLSLLAFEIVSQEAEYCNFNYPGYMLIYPEIEIDKFRTSDSTIIYTLKHKDTDEKFRFAIRGCVIPPGI